MMTKLELALEMAEKNNRCGEHKEEDGQLFICYRLKNHHRFPHVWEPIERVIPFDIQWRPSDHG